MTFSWLLHSLRHGPRQLRQAEMDEPNQPEFRGKINRRLSLIFGILFVAVLLVGGVSLYLARAIFLNTQEIRRERDRVDIVDRVHSTIHHFISALQRAQLLGTALAESERLVYLRELNSLTRRYLEEGKETEVVGEIHRMVGDLALLSERMTQQGAARLQPRDIKALDEAEQRIRGLAHRLSIVHRAEMERLVRESRWKMQMILGFYGAFVVVGSVLILGSSFFFSLTIARPLRGLAQAAADVARGNLRRQVPVISKDEIGQLSHAFNIMTDRLKAHEESLKGLATLAERERLAQELHDSLAQDLALLHLKIMEADQAFTNSGALEAKETLREMRKIAGGAYEDVRQAIFGLRTMVSKGLGLIPTLAEYLHDFSELRKIPVDFKIDGIEAIRFSPQVEIQLIRIIHEALTNVFKHAQATRSEVKIERDGGLARVTIEDDGKGFMTKDVMRNGLRFGLQTMRERAEGVGGKLTIDTAPGKGTRVIVHLPFEKSFHETHSSALG